MLVLRLAREMLLPLFVLTLLLSLFVSAWARNSQITAARGKYGPLDPALAHRVIHHAYADADP